MSFDSLRSIRHKQARVLTPSMFIAHDPQMPSRQDRLKVSVGSTSFLILIKASSTYPRADFREPFAAPLAAQTPIWTHHGPTLVQVDIIPLQLGFLGRLIRVLCRWSVRNVIRRRTCESRKQWRTQR